MMLVIGPHNRDKYEDVLEDSYRVRHDLYVKQRGWTALDREDGREIDQFDREDTIYLLRLDCDGGVIGGSRLVSTMGPTLLSEVFPHLVEWSEPPCDPNTYEHTRYFAVGCPKENISAAQVSGEILAAIFEYCLAHDIYYMTTVCDSFFLPMILEFEWGTRPLGLPTAYDEGECVAIHTPITLQGLQSIYSKRHLPGPVLPELTAMVAERTYMRGLDQVQLH